MSFQDVIFTAKLDLTPEIPLHVYLVKGANYAVWIDSGVKGMFPQLVETMGAANVSDGGLRFVLHTHSHHDHIGSNAQLKARTGCLLAAPAHYAAWHADFEVHYNEFARPFPDLFPDTPALRNEALSPLDAPCPLDLHIDEASFFDLGGGVTLTAYSLPGHMLAELGWFEASTRTLILGDAITGIAWPLIHGHLSVRRYRATLNRLRWLIPELHAERVICAHFPMMTPDEALALADKADAYIDSIETNLIRQLAASSSPLSLETLWRTLCAQMNKLPEFRSLSTVDAHMADLTRRRVVHQVAPHTYTLK